MEKQMRASIGKREMLWFGYEVERRKGKVSGRERREESWDV